MQTVSEAIAMSWQHCISAAADSRIKFSFVNSVAMSPKAALNRVASLYKAGHSKEDVRSCLKRDGYKAARISQLLKEWPPAGVGNKRQRPAESSTSSASSPVNQVTSQIGSLEDDKISESSPPAEKAQKGTSE